MKDYKTFYYQKLKRSMFLHEELHLIKIGEKIIFRGYCEEEAMQWLYRSTKDNPLLVKSPYASWMLQAKEYNVDGESYQLLIEPRTAWMLENYKTKHVIVNPESSANKSSIADKMFGLGANGEFPTFARKSLEKIVTITSSTSSNKAPNKSEQQDYINRDWSP